MIKCKHCGSTNITGRGTSIMCKDCRRSSIKISRRSTPADIDRPYCPECGAASPYATGSNRDRIRLWTCRSCGRNYSDKQTKDESRNIEVTNDMEVQIE